MSYIFLGGNLNFATPPISTTKGPTLAAIHRLSEGEIPLVQQFGGKPELYNPSLLTYQATERET